MIKVDYAQKKAQKYYNFLDSLRRLHIPVQHVFVVDVLQSQSDLPRPAHHVLSVVAVLFLALVMEDWRERESTGAARSQ